uniref:Transcriptional regulator, BadM/Rrf2 family n=1 Tax=Chlorobium chlorochromatii (strain CaD3) TaxID=340177 RepID=Q3AQH6_CHLCH
MKILTKKADYAIRALLMLAAKEGGFMSAKAIAEAQDIPYQFLRSLLQELMHHHLVASKEGAHGGFRIETNPDNISVKQLIEIFQGEVQVSECMFRKQVCRNRSSCVLRHEIMRIEEVVSHEFGQLTIGSLLRKLQMQQGTGAA